MYPVLENYRLPGTQFDLDGFLELDAGDDVCVKIRNTGDNDDPTLISSQWIINMLHPK